MTVRPLLLASVRRGRPVSFRSVVAAYHAVNECIEPAKRFVERAEMMKMPLAEVGTNVLICSSSRPRSPAIARVSNRGVVEVGNLQDTLNELDASWTTLKNDIQRSHEQGQVTAAFWEAFVRDFGAWTNYHRRYSNAWVAGPGTLGEADRQRTVLTRWRSAYAALGLEPSGLQSVPPGPGVLERAASTLGPGGINAAANSISNVGAAIAVVAVAGVVALVVIEAKSVLPRF